MALLKPYRLGRNVRLGPVALTVQSVTRLECELDEFLYPEWCYAVVGMRAAGIEQDPPDIGRCLPTFSSHGDHKMPLIPDNTVTSGYHRPYCDKFHAPPCHRSYDILQFSGQIAKNETREGYIFVTAPKGDPDAMIIASVLWDDLEFKAGWRIGRL
jgi:hypothetical protein